MKIKKIKTDYYGLGRRKSSVARVILRKISDNKGKISINGKDINSFFPYQSLVDDIKKGLSVTKNESTFEVISNVNGGGFSGQAGALRYGIVKALVNYSEEYRKPLREAGLLSRDSRSKERRKYGLKKARKGPQFSKR